MALNGLRTAEQPDRRGIPEGVQHGLTLSFEAAEALEAFQLVALDADGKLEACGAVADKVIGMVTASVAAGENAAVVVGGVVEQDALTASATHTALKPGTTVYLAPAVADFNAAGQALSASSASSAVVVGRCLDVVDAPGSGSRITRARVLLTTQAAAWQ